MSYLTTKKMVKGKEGITKKKDLLILFGALITIGILVFVIAAASTMDLPVTEGNYTSTLNLTFIITPNDINNMTNATCWYNISGAALGSTFLAAMANLSVAPTVFNTTVDISAFTSSATYNISCQLSNASSAETYLNATFTAENVTIDNTPPNVNFSYSATATVYNGGNYTSTSLRLAQINVTFVDTISQNVTIASPSVYLNISNSSGGWAPTDNWTLLPMNNSVTFSGNINFTDYPDGKYNITIIANDSIHLVNAAATSVANVNNSEYIEIAIDDTPVNSISATLANSTKTSLSLNLIITDETSGPHTCSATRTGGDPKIYGVGANQVLVETGLTCNGYHTYIINCTDYASNSASITTESFRTDSCSGAVVASGGGVSTEKKTQSWNTVGPGEPITMKNFGSDVGVKEIKIEVKSETQDVKVVVSKYDTKPSGVLVSKTGTYSYLQIDTENLEDSLDKATMTIQVKKSWVNEQGISKDDISLFKYDGSLDKWDELTTTYDSEDDNYYYYISELTSFSYFSIAPKGTTAEEGEIPSGGEEEALSSWVWVIIGIIVVAIIIGGGVAFKKKR